MNESRLWLAIMKKFFTVRLMKHWNRLLREAVGVTSLAVFKTRIFEQPDVMQVVPPHNRQLPTTGNRHEDDL